MLKLIEFDYLTNDAKSNRGYETLSRATSSHIFMIL